MEGVRRVRPKRGPFKLYDLCLDKFCEDFFPQGLYKKCYLFLPNTVLLDFYERLYEKDFLSFLTREFGCMDILKKLLQVKARRRFLLHCFQTVLNNCYLCLPRELCFCFETSSTHNIQPKPYLIELGLNLGYFFNDGGWFRYSIELLIVTERLIKCFDTTQEDVLLQLLECYRLQIYANSLYCQFSKAAEVFSAAKEIIERLHGPKAIPSLAGLYCCFSTYHFILSNFDESYDWAIKALKLLPNNLTKRTFVDVLRQASKACVVKRKFIQAELLIRQAVNLGEQLSTFSDSLMDYGFFLLNSDSVRESVKIYHTALAHRLDMFQRNNLLIALAHEDLAYSLYVKEYSSGKFWLAKEHAENSIEIMKTLLPYDHLLVASVKRVKALILEEFALDERSDAQVQQCLLDEAEDLHKTALRLSQNSFGEKNLQTAKHYGNLGRLYQSMKRFEESEKMHLQAISIKEELLGPNDYEVGLSVGHLASLYNYHMKKYVEAEELYLRSIEINIRLFGIAYSGLEYDYRGLIHVYTKLVEPLNAVFYNRKLREWKELRNNVAPLKHEETVLEPADIVRRFFEIGEEQGKLERERMRLAEEFRLGKERRKSSQASDIQESENLW